MVGHALRAPRPPEQIEALYVERAIKLVEGYFQPHASRAGNARMRHCRHVCAGKAPQCDRASEPRTATVAAINDAAALAQCPALLPINCEAVSALRAENETARPSTPPCNTL
jgi:hypothetical protein